VSFWGREWTLVAWCEERRDFRSFRLDRISRLEVSDEIFADEEGKTLREFLISVNA
jgi:predicted DNA-binding transcriptional regulator YafY